MYSLPDGMTNEQAKAGLIELLRPCSPGITAHMARLQAFKPLGDAERIQIVFDALYDDIQQMPEVAVVLALDDLRQDDTIQFFPLTRIKPECAVYRDLIYDCIDYLESK